MSLPPPPDPAVDPAAYLRSIYAVRQRTRLVLDKAKKDELKHFKCDMTKFPAAADYVVSIIKRDFAPDYARIPPHGRWQHFDVGGTPRVEQLMASWPPSTSAREKTRRLLDLFLVSVLLDAGAGNRWKYAVGGSGEAYGRSEGLAVASLEMFKAGLFSSDAERPWQVDGAGLRALSVGRMAEALQVSEQNPMDGLEGRTNLLIRLGDALENKTYFGADARPGNMIGAYFASPHPSRANDIPTDSPPDYLAPETTTSTPSTPPTIPIPTFWDMLMHGLAPIWPAARTSIANVPLGDAWPCASMPTDPSAPWKNIVPFHKLTQWLAYSLMVPMQALLGVRFAGAELMTGLPEYRNGGLLVDTGVLTLREEDMARGASGSSDAVPLFAAEDDVVVEWRAVTVGMLDELLVAVNEGLGLEGDGRLSLAQMLEAGSWKGGREIARTKRPETGGPPIMIQSDGTVF